MDRRIVQSIDESDEEELEVLRLAALRSRRQKESYAQKWQSRRDIKEDTRRVSLGCDERSVVETDERDSSSSTDYEEIDLNGTSPCERNEDFETHTDSEENENVFMKKDSVSGTPSDFENVEENGAPSEDEDEYLDLNTTAKDQSAVVETEAGVVDNLTITFSNESGENELENRANVTQSDMEEEEGEEDEEIEETEDEEEEEEMEEEEEEEMEEAEEEIEEEEGNEELAVEDNSEEELASTSDSDLSEQEEESQFQTSHTRIIITESEGEEEEEEELVDNKYRETKESAVLIQNQKKVSVNGPLVPQLTAVQSAIKCSSKDSTAKTVVQEKVAASSKRLTAEKPPSKSIIVSKTASNRDLSAEKVEHKENEVSCSDNGSKEYALSKSKPVSKTPEAKESEPKKHKQKGKHTSLSETKLLKEKSLSTTKPVHKTPPQVRNQLEKEGKKNGSKARPSEKDELKSTTKTPEETSQKSLKSPLAQESVKAAPLLNEELDDDADRLSIGTSDEDNEFEQSEEPAIKSKIGAHRFAASSSSHTASRDRSRHRRSRSRDKSSSPRRSWSRDRDRDKFRLYDKYRARDTSGLRDSFRLRARSESRGRQSSTRCGGARVRDRSRERTRGSNRRRRSERSPLTNRGSDRRRSRERQAPQVSRERRKDRKRSWSYDSPSPGIKSKPSVNTSGSKPAKRKESPERTRLGSRPAKDRKKGNIESTEKREHSQPSKKIKAVVVNGQKGFVRSSSPAKQDVVLREKKRSKGEGDLRAKLKTQSSKDPLGSKTVVKDGSTIGAHAKATGEESRNKTVSKKVTVVRRTGGTTREKDLDTKISKNQEQNKSIAKMAEKKVTVVRRTGGTTREKDLDTKISKNQEQNKSIAKMAEKKVTVVRKTGSNTGEEDLDTRIAKIREQNKNILKRAREIEADKKKASHGRSCVL